jgi:hypothetical protein
VGYRLTTCPCKTQIVTETKVKFSWKILSKMTFGPKQVTKTGCWHVRSVWVTGCLNQVVQEMKNYNLEIMGLSETRWTLFGEHQAQDGELLLYSGREDEQHKA